MIALLQSSSKEILHYLPENSSRPSPSGLRSCPTLRRLGARRSLPFRAHEALPCHGGEEDRSPGPAPRGRLSPAVRQDPHPAALPRPRDRGTAYPCASLQGKISDYCFQITFCSSA